MSSSEEELLAAARSFTASPSLQTEKALKLAALAFAAETIPARRHPLDHKRRCISCGKLSRITTAGCDHCDFEDK